jgi:hypothetical protein
MSSLSSSGFAQARRFLLEDARPLERSRFLYAFEGGSVDDVLAELASFQNADGGFGNALEPDLRTPASSALATSIAFQILRELPAGSGAELAAGAIGWLSEHYDPEARSWPIIPEAANHASRAPWWNHDGETAAKSKGNPLPELAGYLFDFEDISSPALREEAFSAAQAYLDGCAELEMHELQCYVRLLDTRDLPEEARERMLPKVRAEAEKLVLTDPAAWSGYGLRPLGVVESPSSVLISDFARPVELELDTLLATQGEDGAWAPSWVWFGSDDPAWNQAEKDWKGWITFGNLQKLRAFSRIE